MLTTSQGETKTCCAIADPDEVFSFNLARPQYNALMTIAMRTQVLADARSKLKSYRKSSKPPSFQCISIPSYEIVVT
jgi:hypothetical protein